MDTNTDTTKRPRRFRLRWMMLALPAVLGGAFLFSTGAHAFGRGHHDLSDAEMDTFVERRLERVLDRIDATDAQKAQVKTIVERAKPELKALRSERVKLRERFAQIMGADKVDPAAAEALRKESVALVERASNAMSRTLVDIGNVLTVDQRRELLAFARRFHG